MPRKDWWRYRSWSQWFLLRIGLNAPVNINGGVISAKDQGYGEFFVRPWCRECHWGQPSC
jgi:hypothetical protein